ncbi:MAG TPA: DUF3579 domain-containing protein [Aeromonadales bacterium]|nr:DUF3579 domain-containing protein [Aeromonadales bacterium]
MEQQAKTSNQLIIRGITSDGRKFRPSDWAERLCGHMATFKHRRIYFSPKLRPAVIDGIKCVIVDLSIRESDPKIHQTVISFAKTNGLEEIFQ